MHSDCTKTKDYRFQDGIAGVSTQGDGIKEKGQENVQSLPPVLQEQSNCYTVREVAEMFDLSEWTIRMWCNRFDILKCRRNDRGDIIFFPENVRIIGMICCLTKKKRMTLAGVRKHLKLMDELILKQAKPQTYLDNAQEEAGKLQAIASEIEDVCKTCSEKKRKGQKRKSYKKA